MNISTDTLSEQYNCTERTIVTVNQSSAAPKFGRSSAVKFDRKAHFIDNVVFQIILKKSHSRLNFYDDFENKIIKTVSIEMGGKVVFATDSIMISNSLRENTILRKKKKNDEWVIDVEIPFIEKNHFLYLPNLWEVRVYFQISDLCKLLKESGDVDGYDVDFNIKSIDVYARGHVLAPDTVYIEREGLYSQKLKCNALREVEYTCPDENVYEFKTRNTNYLFVYFIDKSNKIVQIDYDKLTININGMVVIKQNYEDYYEDTWNELFGIKPRFPVMVIPFTGKNKKLYRNRFFYSDYCDLDLSMHINGITAEFDAVKIFSYSHNAFFKDT